MVNFSWHLLYSSSIVHSVGVTDYCHAKIGPPATLPWLHMSAKFAGEM